jgi:hypothetical protein
VVRDGELPSPGLAGAPAGGALFLAPIRSTGPTGQVLAGHCGANPPRAGGPVAEGLFHTVVLVVYAGGLLVALVLVAVGRTGRPRSPRRSGRLGRPSLRTRLLTVSGQPELPAIECSAGELGRVWWPS